MTIRAPQRPRLVRQIAAAQTDPDRATSSAVDQVSAELARIGGLAVLDRQTFTADLVVGLNKINHSLRRAPRGYTLTATVADATFAHALTTSGNSQPARQIWITVVGVDQPRAVIEVF